MSSEGNLPVEIGRGPCPLELGKPALGFILWAVGAWKDPFIQQIGSKHMVCPFQKGILQKTKKSTCFQRAYISEGETVRQGDSA